MSIVHQETNKKLGARMAKNYDMTGNAHSSSFPNTNKILLTSDTNENDSISYDTKANGSFYL
jgi:hypothetical protein